MEFDLDTRQWEKWWGQVQQWLHHEVLITATLIQLAILAAGLVVAYFLSRPILKKIDKAESSSKWLANPVIHAISHDLLLPLLWLLIHGIAILVLHGMGIRAQLLTVTATLLAAWVAIRFFSTFVRNNSLSRFIAMVAWVIAAMSIVGWLEPTIEFLDGLAFNLGELRVSVLTIIKGLITLGFLLWVAVAISNMTERQMRNLTGLTPSLQVLFSKLIKILLITFAILIGVSSVGIDITALAVFSGAVGVGIGFGLQKIVSNFISGVILLLDRSIKPGDVIEVDDTYGWINKLSGRHVSVITRDGKEHLIPNEDLITQKVINWSYSNKAVRIRVPISISYNADLHLARKIILEAAGKVPRVLANPAPVCLLWGFGDNSVDLELRVWIEDPANGVANIRSQILLEVWDGFHANAIQIPFPQRDVHLDVSQELLELLKAQKRQKTA